MKKVMVEDSRSMTNSMKPKVSVCMPVYNGSAYIAESIDSILAQTYRDFELVVCDNCSTDNTEDIVRGFSDSRITYTRNPRNLGLVGNANRCLELATGEYVCILHHDDLMLPENLERKVRLLEEYPHIGFVHSDIALIDQEGKVISDHIWCEDSRRDYMEKGLIVFRRFLEYLHFGASIFIGAVVARRQCYDHLGGFSPELPHCNDSEMWMRLSLFYNVACIGTPLVKYRAHQASTSSNWGNYTSAPYIREHYKSVRIVFENYGERIPDAGSLFRGVSLAFGKQALKLSCSSFDRGDSASAAALLKDAVRMAPRVVTDVLFWKAAARFAVGSRGVNLLRTMRDDVMK